jgi:hypothetical protein
MPEPLDHIRRGASVPWRAIEDHLTECGLMAANVPAITLDEMRAKIKRQGVQRAGLSSCMTCWNLATRYQGWDEDPTQAIRREVFGSLHSLERFRLELRAIAALIANHPEEFQKYIDSLGMTVDLTRRRRQAKGTKR